MFIKKTQEEIDKMTPAEADVYFAQKEIADNAEAQKKLDDLAEKMRLEFKGDLDKANKAVSDMQEIINTMKETADGKEAVKKGTFVTFVEDNIKKFSETDKQYGSSTVIKVAALMTTANVTPNVAGGFSPLFGNFIDTEIGHVPKPENIILPLVTVKTQPGTENIWTSDRINEEGDAEFIAEGALKPLTDGEYKEYKADIKEVAVRWKMSNRLIKHAPSVVTDFRQHATELVEQVIDTQVLTGDGTNDTVNGVADLASPFVVPTGLAGYYEEPNILDAIMAVATYVRLNNFKGNLTCVLNTVWQAKMLGIKDPTTGIYIIAPFVTQDGKKVGETTIRFENKMDADKILLGDLKQFKVRISENVAYYEGWEDDDFSKNLSSRKIEAFLGTYFPSNLAGSIIYDDISTVLTAIAAT